ncbi:T9SS type A sorting domain-containing protein [Mucilaginibacter sp.]|uniref:T9SS type A sorting domain-containing protein n=1 Tax=Mucilaginibacter sp. TaxID=1882438 RepID=UPI002610E0F7|nr:T9SS type A sorting domain-containing protein [Mucilaginibacter sp.]MDB4926240.1 hypothetical protein [Mucilaginibacter sp.]
MRRIFTYTNSWIIIIAIAIFMNYAFAAAAILPQHDTTNYFFSKKKPKKGILSLSIPPIKPGIYSTTKVNVPRLDDKLLSNVEVYPNPITDQINLKYMISRNTNVTIKMVDVLGNDVITLFSQRVDPGEQILSRQLNNKLNRGFYFIRVIAGTESIIKRISVL